MAGHLPQTTLYVGSHRVLQRDNLDHLVTQTIENLDDLLDIFEQFIRGGHKQHFAVVVTTDGDPVLHGLVGDENLLPEENQSDDILKLLVNNGNHDNDPDLQFFSWGDFLIIPLFQQQSSDANLLGLLGVYNHPQQAPDYEQREALSALSHRAAIALEDRYLQENVFNSLEDLTPQVELIQNLRAAARYEGTQLLTTPDKDLDLAHHDLSKWVKDALSHYWGGPKLTKSPLIELKVVQQAIDDHDGVSTNALRSILKQGIDRVRPEGDRRFTGEWILYNILDMKFMEGRKVREIALRLAMSEADLYRKQRVAIEAVANAIIEMEKQAREEDIKSL